MRRNEFIKYIESLGFNDISLFNDSIIRLYEYKDYDICLEIYSYDFSNGSEYYRGIDLNNLTPINEYLKKELRSIKLKQILK